MDQTDASLILVLSLAGINIAATFLCCVWGRGLPRPDPHAKPRTDYETVMLYNNV